MPKGRIHKRPYTVARPKHDPTRAEMKEWEKQRKRLQTVMDDFFPRFDTNATKGKHNELIAAAFLLRCGFDVYMPFKHSGVDIVAVAKDNRALRFEVRSIGDWLASKTEYEFVAMHERDKGRTDYYIGVTNMLLCVVFEADGKPISQHDYMWYERTNNQN